MGALGDFLAERVKADLTPKGGKPPRVRADTFGYMQRYWLDPSPVDSEEARRVGQFAADVRAVRPPEPYKGKGIRYAGERVRRKVGKAGTA